MITTVTGKNQVTIPAKLAREMKISPGTELDWARGQSPNTIRIRVKPSRADNVWQIRELGAPYRAKAKEMLADLQRMRDEDDPEYGRQKGKKAR